MATATVEKTPRTALDDLLARIANKNLPGVETLETRRSDGLDFHECAVWGIKDALEEAFKAGLNLGFDLGWDAAKKTAL